MSKISNCYHLLNSQYLKKEDRHPNLVMSSIYDGWLVPNSCAEILLQYPQYIHEQVFDPVIDESKEIQKLRYRKKILKSKDDKIAFHIFEYSKATQKTVAQLKLEDDPIFHEYVDEHERLLNDIDQINREINHQKNKPNKTESTPTFHAYSLDELLAMPPKEWVVDNVFGQGDLGVIYGPPGCGKTFVVIDFVLKLCVGKRWAHRFDVKRPLNIAYCAGEGHGALPDRFRTAVKHHNITSPLSNFSYFKGVPQLFDENDPNYIVKFISEKQKSEKKLDLLVIDTLITASAGADENSSQDMRKIIQSCQMAIKSLDCAILLVHHTNKAEEVERGSSALRGACDFMIKIKKSSDSGTNASIECSKSKDGETWLPQNFNLCTIEGFNSVHVAWDIVGADENMKESKESLKIRLLEVLAYYPDDKFTCKALSVTINQDEKFTNKLLNILVNENKCTRSKEAKNIRANPWLYSHKI